MDLKHYNFGLTLISIIIWDKLDPTGATTTYCPERTSLNLPGQLCQRSCVNDEDCRSKKKYCACDMDCGMSCIKKRHRCKPLPDINNGHVEMPRELGFGSTAKYDCNPGYRLFGTKVRACQGDESWSNKEPQCIPDKNASEKKQNCGVPPVVKHAEHNGPQFQKTFIILTMLDYKCMPGYVLERGGDTAGVTSTWCVEGGNWVGPNMRCIPRKPEDAGCSRLPTIDNGFVKQADVVEIGGRAEYKCNPGYFLAGRETRICGSNGRWDGVPPSCETVTCGPPPMIPHADHNGNKDQMRFPTGAQLLYECYLGYHKSGTPRVMCTEGRWTGLTLTCTAIGCGFPGDVTNGQRLGYSFLYTNTVTYQCNEGYEMIGEGYRECKANGEWSNDVPICRPVTCPTLFSPVFGSMIGEGTSYGTVIRFECEKKFKVVGSVERRCQSDRTWSGSLSKCEEIDCGWPEPFYNGYLVGTSTTVGSLIYFSCSPLTTFQGDNFQTQCQDDGTWSEEPPVCLGQCLVPNLPNATLLKGKEGDYVNHGSEIEFKCHNGMVPRYGALMKCLNGTWTVDAECVPGRPPCPKSPPNVRNGMRVYMGLHHMAKAKYKCFPGYRLDNTKMNTTYLTCTFGDWVGGTPQCEEFYCPSPKHLENGQVFKKLHDVRFLFKSYIRTIQHGTRIEYKCNPGYRLVGPSGATCVNGEWRPAMSRPGTKCERSVHPPFRKLWSPIPNDGKRK